MTVLADERKQLLEQYGRFYGQQRFAVTFTASDQGEDAKRVTSKGWDRSAPLATADFAAALIGGRGMSRNVAIVLRPSNLIVLECDTEEDLARIGDLDLPLTLTVRSSEPYKRHFYFRPAPTLEALPYVAFRFESGKLTADSGRYFLAPPSIHPSGAVYSFLAGLGPEDTEIAVLPEQVYRQLAEQARVEDSELRQAIEHDPNAKIRAGNRRDFLFRYACMLRRWGLSREETLTATLAFNNARCDPPVEPHLVAVQVDGAMKKQGDQEITAAANGATPTAVAEPGAVSMLRIESWQEFEAKALDHVPTLVEKLWPEAAFAFIAAPPKKGKTWVGLALTVSLASGKTFLERFPVPKAKPVLYVALEGHRAGLRARVGALARGLGLDPDPGSGDLANLHWLYKPAGMNLSDPKWGTLLHQAAAQVNAALVVVDVLRASARLKENDQEAFSGLRYNLQPVTDAGHSVAMLHHFGKLTETQKERDPGERMSGSGAMFGALDVAIYITGSENGARKLRLEFDTRDIAAPDHFSIELFGDGTGENGGFTYRDTAIWRPSSEVGEEDLKAPAPEIAEWVREQGGEARAMEVRAVFEISDHTFNNRLGRLRELGVDYVRAPGKPGMLVARPDAMRPEPELHEDFGCGANPRNHAGLRPEPEPTRSTPLRTPESGDLQDNQRPEDPELPTGEPDSTSELAELSILEGDPEPFERAQPEPEEPT